MVKRTIKPTLEYWQEHIPKLAEFLANDVQFLHSVKKIETAQNDDEQQGLLAEARGIYASMLIVPVDEEKFMQEVECAQEFIDSKNYIDYMRRFGSALITLAHDPKPES